MGSKKQGKGIGNRQKAKSSKAKKAKDKKLKAKVKS